MSWAGRRVCVAGIGVSGVAAAEALLQRGARVTVVDARDGAGERERAERLRGLGSTVLLGAQPAPPPTGTELVVASPGWRPDHPLLAGAPELIGEVELAWRLRPPAAAPWLAVTGTNGKTTTVRMLAGILSAAGRHAVAAGNVGTPLVRAVLATPAPEVLAVELSSFQLHLTSTVQPAAAAVLNVAEDHLDWHGSFAAYAADKARVFGPGTPPVRLAVGNAADPVSADLLRRAPALRRVLADLGPPGPDRLGVADGRLVGFDGEELAPVQAVTPASPHNLLDALVAAALARAVCVPPAAVAAGLAGIRPDRHRHELVATVRGVAYVDDSKATNPHAAAAALRAHARVVWLAGGLLKGADVDRLVADHADRLRGAVLLGRDRHLIRRALARHAPTVPVVDVAVTEDGAMRMAVEQASRLARPGDTVLLAPAAASMDMFRDYAERGDRFAAAVRGLAR